MKLSIRNTLLNDYPSTQAWMVILCFWLIPALIPDERRLVTQGTRFIWFSIFVTGLLCPVLLWRLYRASRLFRLGRIAAAHITNVWVASRGPITFYFAFEYEGRSIHARMRVSGWKVVGWKSVPAFKRGQNVEALYDPADPSRAIILSLFQA
jgi:hypothetical protein